MMYTVALCKPKRINLSEQYITVSEITLTRVVKGRSNMILEKEANF